MSTKTLMTVEEFAEMATSETEHYELVQGELIPWSSGSPNHAYVRGAIEHLLRGYFERNPIGKVFSEIDCRLTDDTVRRPDVASFLDERLRLLDRRKIPVPFAPDIAVEVLSPSESAIDVHRKALEYLAAGTREVWQLDFENGEIFVQIGSGIRLLRGGDALETPLLPGFSEPVAKILAGF